MINKKYLPSKKFIAALSVALVVILITIILNSIKPSAPRYESTDLTALSATSSVSEIDSDNDGLPDWEKALYGIDPHNIDMAGDGTPNGEKIKEGRNPLIPNTAPAGQTPNDEISPNLIAESEAISAVDQNINATQKMAQDLLSNIIASQPVSGTMDQDTIDDLVQQSLQDLPQKQFAGTTTVADLNLIPIPTNNEALMADLTTYAQDYYLQIRGFGEIMGQDLAIVNDSMANNSNLDVKKMTSIISVYQTIIHNFTVMPLPALPNSDGVLYQLEIINDLETLVQIDNDIITSSANADTASIYADLGIYNDTLDDLTSAFDTIDAMLGVTK